MSTRFYSDTKSTVIESNVAMRPPVLSTLPVTERAGALVYNQDILKFRSDEENAWLSLAVGSGGSTPAVTGIDNIGTAVGSLDIFDQYDPLDPTEKVAQLRRIAPGTNITLAYVGDSIVITGADSGVTDIVNIGTAVGSLDVFKQYDPLQPTEKVAQFHRIAPGANITLSYVNDSIVITGSAGGASSTLSDGGTAVGHISLVQNGVAPNLATKGLVAGNDISISSTATDATVNLLGSQPATLTIGLGVGVPGNFSTSIGPTSIASDIQSVALGYGALATFANTVAIGYDALANVDSEATAIGTSSRATDLNSTAIGYGAIASAPGTTAVGRSATASLGGATALGRSAIADQSDATAVGRGAQAKAPNSVSIGQAFARSLNSVAIGNNATVRLGIAPGSIAIGFNSDAAGEGNVVIGTNSIGGEFNAIAIGTNADASVGDANTAIGRSAVVHGSQALGVGFSCQVDGSQSIGVGWQCVVPGTTSTAFGHNVNITASDACCFGNGIRNSTNRSIVIGTFGNNSLRLDPIGLGNVTQTGTGLPVTVNAGWGRIIVRGVLAGANETFVFNNSRINVNSIVFLTAGGGDSAGPIVTSYSGLVNGQITIHIRNLSSNAFVNFPLNYWVVVSNSSDP